METIILKNNELEVHLIKYGAAINKIIYHDVDVVLGYETLEEYQQHDANFGANCGRVANRIKGGKFTLEGKEYQLAINNGPNALHGGNKGFDKCMFEVVEHTDTKAVFHYLAKDNEEGYPGNLDLKVIYTLDNNQLKLNYVATTDKTTIVNLTNHSYFNLSKEKLPITSHKLEVNCDHVYKVDADGLIQNEYFDVTNTPFDYRVKKNIIFTDDENLKLGTGYDHFFILNDHSATLSYNDLSMKVTTDYPGAQIYSANFLTYRKGKYNQYYDERKALCIECSFLPDSINIEKNPQVILRPGEVYNHYIAYEFTRK